ncbi:MAG TPA: TRAP transporter small permease [Methylomirabilota bacterium]|nr:TRAP transporter small permease [Methylomirabilota bacterium]
MERLFGRLEPWLGPVLAALLAFITVGVFIQVVLRYVFALSFLWGEELSLFAFIWCVFLGTAVCSWRHTHFSFDMLSGAMPARAEGVQRLVVDLCILTVTVVMVVTGWQFSNLSVARLSPALGITLFVPTIVIPVSGVLMTLVCLIDIVRDCRQIATGERSAGTADAPPIDFTA